MVTRILGVVHCRENLTRVFANSWHLEAEKDSKQQHPIENGSQHARGWIQEELATSSES
jgi:hypothetical protein